MLDRPHVSGIMPHVYAVKLAKVETAICLCCAKPCVDAVEILIVN